MPPDSLGRAPVLLLLIFGLLARFRRKNRLVDLELAIRHSEEALKFAGIDNVVRVALLVGRSFALTMRFEHFHQRTDLDAAIEHAESALTLLPHDNAELAAAAKFCLLITYLVRFHETGDSTDMVSAKDIMTQLPPKWVSMIPPEWSPDKLSLKAAGRARNHSGLDTLMALAAAIAAADRSQPRFVPHTAGADNAPSLIASNSENKNSFGHNIVFIFFAFWSFTLLAIRAICRVDVVPALLVTGCLTGLIYLAFLGWVKPSLTTKLGIYIVTFILSYEIWLFMRNVIANSF